MVDIPPDAFPSIVLAEASLPVPLPLAIILFFVGLAGFALVNAIEIAVVASNRIRVRTLAEEGSRSAAALEKLKAQQDTFFGALVILQNVTVFLVSTAGTVVAIDTFGGWGFLFGLVAVPLISTEFGEYTPKVIAARIPERIALAVALPVEVVVFVMRPVARALSFVPDLFVRPQHGPTVTETELRMLIDIGAEEGAVGEGEAEMLERVFHFHDRRVNEIMIPRTEVSWLEKDESVREFYETFDKTPHSRFPVYDDTVDNVVGIIAIKDVLRALAEHKVTEDAPIAPLMRPATFVPETKLVSALLVQLQVERQLMAIVVDEYGGVAGIVTLERLLEEMVGNVADELGRDSEEIVKVDADTTRVDGGMSIYDLREEMGLEVPEGEYETIAGYVLQQLGHIPRTGEAVTLDGYRIAVSEVNGVKIESVEITNLPAAAPRP